MAAAVTYVVDRENPDIAVGHRGGGSQQAELECLLYLAGDDLRETARAVGAVELWLERALDVIEAPLVCPGDLGRLAGDVSVIEKLDTLADTLSGLRRRLAAIARRVR